MIKSFEEALNETVNKFADVLLVGSHEPRNATNLTNAVDYLESTPQIRSLRKYCKVLEIIDEYQVDVWLLKQCDYENYIRIRKEAEVSIGQIVNENGILSEDEIPQEEFEFIKRYYEEQDKGE